MKLEAATVGATQKVNIKIVVWRSLLFKFPQVLVSVVERAIARAANNFTGELVESHYMNRICDILNGSTRGG